MRYVILFVSGFFFLFYDGYYNAWRYTNSVMRQVDSLLGYVMSLFG